MTMCRSSFVPAVSVVALALYALVLVAPFARHFFALVLPGPGGIFVVLAGAALAVAGLWLTDDRFVPGAWRAAPDTPAS